MSGTENIILISGPPCVGKTTLAHALAAHLQGQGQAAAVLEADTTRKRLWHTQHGTLSSENPQATFARRLPPEAYTPAWYVHTFTTLREDAHRLARAGTTVLVAANFATPPAGPDGIVNMPFPPQPGMRKLWLTATEETLFQRLTTRPQDLLGHSDVADPALLRSLLPVLAAIPPSWPTLATDHFTSEEVFAKSWQILRMH